eukprot:COSAG05_NODE_512_length_9090_cov_33.937827_7_plen_83_part_00
MQMRALEVVLKTGKKSKATIGAMRGAWRVAVVWVLSSCMGSEGGATADLHCACLGGQCCLAPRRAPRYPALPREFLPRGLPS